MKKKYNMDSVIYTACSLKAPALLGMFLMIMVTLVKRLDSEIDLSESFSIVKINPKRRMVVGHCEKCGSKIKSGDVFCSAYGIKL